MRFPTKVFLILLWTLNVYALKAETFPSKPIRWVVTSPAGDGGDVTGRLIADKLSKVLSQPITIDNKPGAGGVIGSEIVAKATPDGDTMGWANPQSIRYLVGKIQDRWSAQRINLHLHDTRGMGMANALAALEMGVDDFDAAVAGLGGCPYAGFKDAPGNIATEDLVHMCHELGIETGVNLERLVEVAVEAEKIVGHPLPGKVMRGGRLEAYRQAAQH